MLRYFEIHDLKNVEDLIYIKINYKSTYIPQDTTPTLKTKLSNVTYTREAKNKYSIKKKKKATAPAILRIAVYVSPVYKVQNFLAEGLCKLQFRARATCITRRRRLFYATSAIVKHRGL